MRNRFEQTFERLRAAGRKGLVAYLTAGDPDEAQSERDIRTVIEGGADILELGVPFSDPTADGPTIQAAAFRALRGGMTLSRVLALTRRLRQDYPAVPVVLFGYLNPLYRYGFDALCRDAAAAGADGFLVVDMPFEEAAEFEQPMRAAGLCNIPLIAPTTPAARARTVLADARGFVYYIMVRGVTGARAEVAADVGEHLAMLRACTPLPIAAGFGVSTGEQARRAAAQADAVVVGSALVQAARAGTLAETIRDLRAGLDT
jgi:tryptophan synthase alpha chain